MTKKLLTVFLPILSLTGLLIGGCGPREQQSQREKTVQHEQGEASPSPDEQPQLTVVVAPEQQLQWELLAQHEEGYNSPSPDEQPRLTVVTGPEQVSELEGYVHSSVLQRVSETDFTTYLVLAVFQGWQGAADYSVEVNEITQRGDVITVNAQFLEPDPAEVVKTIQTSPYCVVKVRKPIDLQGEFVFLLIANDKEIERETVAIP
jgi:hypothetical protein